MFLATAATLLLAAVCLAQNHGHGHGHSNQQGSCHFILGANCHTFHNIDKVCGSDGVTYNSECDFAQAHCQDFTLHEAHVGECSVVGPSPTQDFQHGGNRTFSFYCRYFSHMACGDDHEMLCGTDGLTYDNLCTFEKAKCADLTLDIQAMGACTPTF